MSFKKKLSFLLLLFQFISLLVAQKTKFFEISNENTFNKGQFSNAYLINDHFLSLAPKCELFTTVNEVILWNILKTKTHLLVATGHDGLVYLVDQKGKLNKKLKIGSQSEITGFLQGPKNTIFVSSAPEGRIYKISSDYKKVTLFVTLPEQFIWSMAHNGKNLYVACGGNGGIYKVDLASGKWEKFFQSTENNILKIKINKETLYASTSGQGYLYQISKKGKAKVLYDAGGRDINDFIFYKNNILLGTTGKSIQSFVNLGTNKKQMNINKRKMNTNKKQMKQNYIVKIGNNGHLSILATFENELISSLVLDEKKEHLYVAASKDNGKKQKGFIYLIDLKKHSLKKIFFASDFSISSFSKYEDDIFFACGNKGFVYKLNLYYPEKGSYFSDVLDAFETVKWGKLYYILYSPESFKKNLDSYINVLVRSGNTFSPAVEDGWSQWQPLKNKLIQNKASRFLQFKLILNSFSKKVSPLLSDIRIYYARANKPHFIHNVHLQNTISAKKYKKLKLKPYELILLWETYNHDKDLLSYSIYFKHEGAQNDWTLLKKNVKKDYIILNKKNFVEGRYQFKIIADDFLSNGFDNRCIDERVTRNYLIDNTNPKINFEVKGKEKILVKAKDDFSRIKNFKYSFNEQEYVEISPEDGIFDSLEESFLIKSIKENHAKIYIKVEDENKNFAFKTIELKNN